jgi:hypothetical protein
MKTKSVLFFSCFVTVMLAASVATAAPRGGNHFMSMPARGGRPFVANGMGRWSGQHWNGQHWNGGNWGGNWHHHHHHDHDDFNNVVFIGGFPFWGWGWGYPYYGYYPPYGYYPYGYYGSGYYGSYSYNYGNGYGYGHGYDAKVAELQHRLSNAGYYRGEIDGIFGPRTRYALRAYRHDHPNGNDNNNYGGSPTLRDHPYSPPPITTEPSPTY